MIAPSRLTLYIINALIGSGLWGCLVFAYYLYTAQTTLPIIAIYFIILSSILFLYFIFFFVFFSHTKNNKKYIACFSLYIHWWAMFSCLATTSPIKDFIFINFGIIIVSSIVQIAITNRFDVFRGAGAYLLLSIGVGILGYAGGSLIVQHWTIGLPNELSLGLLLGLGVPVVAQQLV